MARFSLIVLRPETRFENRVRHPGEGQDPVRVGRNSKGGSANKRVAAKLVSVYRHPGGGWSRIPTGDPRAGRAGLRCRAVSGHHIRFATGPVRSICASSLPDVPMDPLPQLCLSPASRVGLVGFQINAQSSAHGASTGKPEDDARAVGKSRCVCPDSRTRCHPPDPCKRSHRRSTVFFRDWFRPDQVSRYLRSLISSAAASASTLIVVPGIIVAAKHRQCSRTIRATDCCLTASRFQPEEHRPEPVLSPHMI